ncbi:MAG: transcriptional regulator, TetR family [Solirubrobacterales bacterium]|jgi:AcrR family transcriptional regulator|nr:transcriptional regulator, TetR family [Solirubrobacterales bacterium]
MPEPRAPIELHVLQPAGRAERSDAARNRERILCAAKRLFAERGVECVSMDEIAADAEVGKGTLYRRFGDRSGLALALLEAEDTQLQDAFLRGPAPLGPGAPPRERLEAFFAAFSAFLDEHGDLIAEAERTMPAGARFGGGPYPAYHTHVRILLRELDPALDIDVLAHVLLAPFRAELYRHLCAVERAVGRERLLAVVGRLLDGLA